MRVSASSRLSDESLDRADRVDLKLVDQADGVGELERELRLGPLDEVESGRARGDALTLDRGNTLRGRRVGDRRAHLGRRAVRRHDLTQPVLAGTVGLDVGAQGVRPDVVSQPLEHRPLQQAHLGRTVASRARPG